MNTIEEMKFEEFKLLTKKVKIKSFYWKKNHRGWYFSCEYLDGVQYAHGPFDNLDKLFMSVTITLESYVKTLS